MERKLQALLFDCDGVLAETELDGHRVAYNLAFEKNGVEAFWSPDDYARWVAISGGKERMRAFFASDPNRYPPSRFGDALIQKLYTCKTELFITMSREEQLPARSGIFRLIQEAHDKGVQLFICSTSSRESVTALLCADFGKTLLGWFTGLLCGDLVARKKPAPDIYNLAKERYGLVPSRCVVVEDSRNGLLAAKGAGMHCLVTPSYYTENDDFTEADAVVSCLGDPGVSQVKVIRSGAMRPAAGYLRLKDLAALL